MSRRKQLKMRPVSVKYLEQYNQLLRYVFRVTDRELYQAGQEDEEITRTKFPVLQQADVLGWLNGDKLISQVAAYPSQVHIFDRTYDMGGLMGVDTYSEYSNQGLMHKLLYKVLENTRNKKQSTSYLYPYPIPYYRRKGWEIASDRIIYEINSYQLPKNKQVPGKVERADPESKELRQTYHRYAMQTHGTMLHDDLAWDEYWQWDLNDLMATTYYNERGKPDGYALHWISDGVFRTKDMVFVDEAARNGLWNFINAHFSMISKVIGDIYTDEPLAFLLEDADTKEVISPYIMACIVDIEQFTAQYPLKPDTGVCEWTFTLDDPMFPWNQGIFTLSITPRDKGSIAHSTRQSGDRIDIQTMTTMPLGYKRSDCLHKIGRIHCSPETVNMLKDAIEQQTPYFLDYF